MGGWATVVGGKLEMQDILRIKKNCCITDFPNFYMTIRTS